MVLLWPHCLLPQSVHRWLFLAPHASKQCSAQEPTQSSSQCPLAPLRCTHPPVHDCTIYQFILECNPDERNAGRATSRLRACIRLRRPHRVRRLGFTYRPSAACSHHCETSIAANMVLLRALCAPAQSVHRWSVLAPAAGSAQLSSIDTNQLLTGHQVGVHRRPAPSPAYHC